MGVDVTLRRAAAAWPVLALLSALTTAAAELVVRVDAAALPQALPRHLALWGVASVLWLLAVAGLLARPPRRWHAAFVLLCAALLRLPGWATPPRHSDDYHRYLWDGAVQAAGQNPYAGPPGDAAFAAVRGDPALAGHFARINNRHLPTIYPPAAQGAFLAAAQLSRATGLTPLTAWKLLIAMADGLIGLVLLLSCRSRGRHPGWAAAWALAPLCGVELAEGAHVDALGILPLCAALWLWPAGGARRGALAGALLGLAILVKPLALAPLPALRRPLLTAWPLLLGLGLSAALCVAPYRGAGLGMLGSLGEYGRRWRNNDGAFGVLYAGTEAVVGLVYRPPLFRPWEPWRAAGLSRLLTGRAKGNVMPDELTGALARGLAGGLLLLALWAGRRARLEASTLSLGLVLTYLLLTPTLHPWYPLWGLALAAQGATEALVAPALLLAALAPLGYVPLADYLRGLPWREPLWSRALWHGAAWLALGPALWRWWGRRALGGSWKKKLCAPWCN